MERLLSICKPTFNRKDVLISDIQYYFTSTDKRFCIKVNDNCSTDGTIDELQSISDERLQFKINPENLGTIRNCIGALTGACSKYIMLVLDKDTLDVNELPYFLDYLEKEEPAFGYVDLNIKSKRGVDCYCAGKDAILHTSYLSKHPSGFFWRTDIFEAEVNKPFYKDENISKFDFIFDLINGPIASKYPSSIVHFPLVINANIRTDLPKNKYKGSFGYDASNIYFGKEKRVFEYQTYLRSTLSLDLPAEDKQKLVSSLTDKGIATVTTGLYDFMQNKAACEHYHLHTRIVSIKEMYINTIEILRNLTEMGRGELPAKFIKKTKCYLFLKSVARCAKRKVKAIYTKPHSGMSA